MHESVPHGVNRVIILLLNRSTGTTLTENVFGLVRSSVASHLSNVVRARGIDEVLGSCEWGSVLIHLSDLVRLQEHLHFVNALSPILFGFGQRHARCKVCCYLFDCCRIRSVSEGKIKTIARGLLSAAKEIEVFFELG